MRAKKANRYLRNTPFDVAITTPMIPHTVDRVEEYFQVDVASPEEQEALLLNRAHHFLPTCIIPPWRPVPSYLARSSKTHYPRSCPEPGSSIPYRSNMFITVSHNPDHHSGKRSCFGCLIVRSIALFKSPCLCVVAAGDGPKPKFA